MAMPIETELKFAVSDVAERRLSESRVLSSAATGAPRRSRLLTTYTKGHEA
jgi:hypothetical protein